MAIAEQTHPTTQPTPNQAGVTPSGPKGDNPATAGPGKHDVQSNTPENAKGRSGRLRVACSQCLWLILMDRVLARLRVKFFFAALRVKG